MTADTNPDDRMTRRTVGALLMGVVLGGSVVFTVMTAGGAV